MKLPDTFLAELSEAAAVAKLDANDTVRALSSLVAEADCRDFMIWTGPAYEGDDLLLDVFVLTDLCLFNYWQRSTGRSAVSCTFLESIGALSLYSMDDELRPLVLNFSSSGDSDFGQVFGKKEDAERMHAFLRAIISARTVAKRPVRG